MDILLVVLLLSFVSYVAARLAWRSSVREKRTAGILTEIAAGTRRPALVLHAAGALLLTASIGFGLFQGRVSRGVSVRGVLGALLVVCAGLLMAWAIAELRSWRLLPEIDADHDLCTTGPYGLVRHPMYLALDLLGIGAAVWVATAPAIVAAVLLVVGGDLRARLEEAVLLDAFGDRYREYMRSVGRTIPFLN